jgi:hypothetical protein
MDAVTFTLDGPDHFKAEWSGCKDRKPGDPVKFDLVRKQK